MNLKLPVFATALLLALPLAAAPKVLPNPDFTKGESIPKEAEHEWNLGTTVAGAA